MSQRKTEKQIIEEYFQSFALEECLDEVKIYQLLLLSSDYYHNDKKLGFK
jgi:hypothetical protein